MNMFKQWISWMERRKYKKFFNVKKKKPITKGAFGQPKIWR